MWTIMTIGLIWAGLIIIDMWLDYRRQQRIRKDGDP